MGKTQTKKTDSTTLLPNELQDFQNITSFSDDVLIKLHNHYKRISSLQTDDGVIDYAEFSEIINKDNNMTKRIFNAIDLNRDGVINFREFVKYISCFVNGTQDEKINLSFKLFSEEKTKIINKESMIKLLEDILIVDDSKFIKSFITKRDIENLVLKSFQNVHSTAGDLKLSHSLSKSKEKEKEKEENLLEKNDNIDFKSYKAFIEKNSFVLDWLIVDIERIKTAKEIVNENITKKKNASCFSCK